MTSARPDDPDATARTLALLHRAAAEEARVLEQDGFADALMLRLAQEAAVGSPPPAAAPATAAPVQEKRPQRWASAWIDSGAWLVLPVACLLALGLEVSTDLLRTAQSALAQLQGLGDAVSPGAADPLADAVLGVGGLALAAWSSWVVWQTRHWLGGGPAVARSSPPTPQSHPC